MTRYTIECFNGQQATQNCGNCFKLKSARFYGKGIKVTDTDNNAEYIFIAPVTSKYDNDTIWLQGGVNTGRAFSMLAFDETIDDVETLLGDCNCMCSGAVTGGDTITNFSWNPNTNTVTISTDAATFPLVLSFDAGDVTTTTPLTIGGVSYPAGTDVQTVLNAIASDAHPEMTVTNEAAPFSFDQSTQTLNIPQTPTQVENADGSITWTAGDGSDPITFVSEDDELVTIAAFTIDNTVYPAGTTQNVITDALITAIDPAQDFLVITDADLASAGSPTDSDVVAFVADNDIVDTNIQYNGDGTALNPDYVWAVDQDGTVQRIKSPTTSQLEQYTNGQSEIWATGLGVTSNLNPNTGELVFSIPAGVELKRHVTTFANTDTDDATQNMFLKLDYAGARTFNTSLPKIKMPTGGVLATDSAPSRGAPIRYATFNAEGTSGNSIALGVSEIGGGDGSVVEFQLVSPAQGLQNILTMDFGN